MGIARGATRPGHSSVDDLIQCRESVSVERRPASDELRRIGSDIVNLAWLGENPARRHGVGQVLAGWLAHAAAAGSRRARRPMCSV
jgi:hypothetical protein